MASELDLDRLSELEAKATPGPWVNAVRTGGDFTGLIVHGSRKAGEQETVCYMAKGSGSPDHKFIAALRNAAKPLIAAAREAERLKARLEELDDRPDC